MFNSTLFDGWMDGLEEALVKEEMLYFAPFFPQPECQGLIKLKVNYLCV